MRAGTFTVEKAKTGYWTYLQRSPGRLPKTRLHSFLNWILEQLNLGHFEFQLDSSGEIVSVRMGRGIARLYKSEDGATEATRRRLVAVKIAGLMTQARESGIEPKLADLSKRITQEAEDWGQRNTEFHYAFELVQVLAGLNKLTFELEAPAISGIAPASVVSYLRESTRSWLYGFYGASVALSRACLEEALRVRLSTAGELEGLINWANRSRLLDGPMAQMAHAVRRTGNKFAHGKRITEVEARETLDATRSIVEHLFSE